MEFTDTIEKPSLPTVDEASPHIIVFTPLSRAIKGYHQFGY
jgi:hypothetical protein